MNKGERILEVKIFGDEAFKNADPKTRVEMARVRAYQQIGILIDTPAERVSQQGEIARFTIQRAREYADVFVASQPSIVK